MKQVKSIILVINILIGLLYSCSSNYITISCEIGDIRVTRKMYSHYSELSYCSSTCSDAGSIIIKERKGEYEAALVLDTTTNKIYVTSQSCTRLIPKKIDTMQWQVLPHDSSILIEQIEEQWKVNIDYALSTEIYSNSGAHNARKSRQNSNWIVSYPNHSKWKLRIFGYIGGLDYPLSLFPTSADSAQVLSFVENLLDDVRYISLSNYKHDCSNDIIKKGNDGCQLFHVYYECSTGNGEVIVVKDSTNAISDYLHIAFQSEDTMTQHETSRICKCRSRINSRSHHQTVSVETTQISKTYPLESKPDTIVLRTQYDLIDGHYVSHPVNDIMVYEKP